MFRRARLESACVGRESVGVPLSKRLADKARRNSAFAGLHQFDDQVAMATARAMAAAMDNNDSSRAPSEAGASTSDTTKCISALASSFPGSIAAEATGKTTIRMLRELGFTPEETLFANSTCPDEVNRKDGTWGQLTWGETFNFGGLGGIPFAGKTGFAAYASHIPEGGKLFIFYASHVGIGLEGEVGKLLRRGQSCESSACGAAIGAYRWACGERDRERECIHQGLPFKLPAEDPEDAQMEAIKRLIFNNSYRIRTSSRGQAVELHEVMYEECRRRIHSIIPKDFGYDIALLGGIQVNTCDDATDFLALRHFEVRKAHTGEIWDHTERFAACAGDIAPDDDDDEYDMRSPASRSPARY